MSHNRLTGRKAGHRRSVYVGMEPRFALMHREEGMLGTFKTLVEAGSEMARLLKEDPSRAGDLWIKPVEAVGANQLDGARKAPSRQGAR